MSSSVRKIEILRTKRFVETCEEDLNDVTIGRIVDFVKKQEPGMPMVKRLDAF